MNQHDISFELTCPGCFHGFKLPYGLIPAGHATFRCHWCGTVFELLVEKRSKDGGGRNAEIVDLESYRKKQQAKQTTDARLEPIREVSDMIRSGHFDELAKEMARSRRRRWLIAVATAVMTLGGLASYWIFS